MFTEDYDEVEVERVGVAEGGSSAVGDDSLVQAEEEGDTVLVEGEEAETLEVVKDVEETEDNKADLDKAEVGDFELEVPELKCLSDKD